MIANARMYALNDAVAGAWRRLFAWIALHADVPLQVIDHAAPAPLAEPLATTGSRLRDDLRISVGNVERCDAPRPAPLAVPIPSPARFGAHAALLERYRRSRRQPRISSERELAGTRLVFTTVDSQSGYQAPRACFSAHALAAGGRLFGTTIGPVVTPRRVVDNLLTGAADAGPLDAWWHDLLRHHEPAVAARSRVIARTPSTPMPLFAASGTMAQDAKARLIAAFDAVATTHELAETARDAPAPRASRASIRKIIRTLAERARRSMRLDIRDFSDSLRRTRMQFSSRSRGLLLTAIAALALIQPGSSIAQSALPEQGCSHTRAVPARRPLPTRCAHCRRQARPGARAAVRRSRIKPRRRRQHRDGARRQSSAGRLHADARAGGQSDDRAVAVHEASVRSGEGLRADHRDRDRAERPDRPPIGSGQDLGRADRAREGEARHAQLRVARERQRTRTSPASCSKSMAGIDIVHIPFNGVGPAMAAVLGGEVQLFFAQSSAALPHDQVGQGDRARRGESPSALPPRRSCRRSPKPVFRDSRSHRGTASVAPAGTPLPIVERLHARSPRRSASPDVREKISSARRRSRSPIHRRNSRRCNARRLRAGRKLARESQHPRRLTPADRRRQNRSLACLIIRSPESGERR